MKTVRSVAAVAATLVLALVQTAAQTRHKSEWAESEPRATAASSQARTTESNKPGKKPHSAGRDRWKVKTASDPDAGEIDARTLHTTIETLLDIPRPVDLPLAESNPEYQDRRVRPVETSVWSVEADITDCRLMPDGDYRVTLRGASGRTMVVEMPDPDPKVLDPKGRFAGQIKSARAQFDAKRKPEHATQAMKGHVVITGVGFFSRAYGKNKVDAGSNLVQLHPVLDVQWLDAPTIGYAAAARPGAASGKTPSPLPEHAPARK